MRKRKPIPTESYPPEDYKPKHDAKGHCYCCGLPSGRVYPRSHASQEERCECLECGATWYEVFRMEE